MAIIETKITLDKKTFDQITHIAQDLNISQNRLFSMALEEFILRIKNKKLLDEINAAYNGAHKNSLRPNFHINKSKFRHKKHRISRDRVW